MSRRTARFEFLILTVVVSLISVSVVAQEKNPDRNAYFGETHVHTSWSFDAFIFGNHITGPADAYKYFKGETIKHPLGYDNQDHHAARLGRCNRSLGVCRH